MDPKIRDALLRGKLGPLAAQKALRDIEGMLVRKGQASEHRVTAAANAARSQFRTMPREAWPVQQPYPPPDRWVILPNVGSLGPGLTSIGYRLEFKQGAGLVLGWNGSAVAQSDQNLACSSLRVRIAWNGEEELITNGTSADSVRFSDVFKSSYPYSPLLVRVTREDSATIYFTNDHTANTYTPSLAFGMWDRDRENRYRHDNP